MFLVSNNVATLQRLIGQIGSDKDTPDLRLQLHSLTDETRGMLKQTSVDLKQLGATRGQLKLSQFEERQRKTAQQKLEKNYDEVLKRFHAVAATLASEKSRTTQTKSFTNKTANTTTTPPSSSYDDDDDGDEPSESAPLIQRQRRRHHDTQVSIEFTEALIHEREQDLAVIERSIGEVNEIFRDLGTLVHEQGYMLDNIESNVSQVAINMEDATGELQTAARYQKSAHGRMCCLMVFLAVLITIVVIVVIS